MTGDWYPRPMQVQVSTPADLEAYDDSALSGGTHAVVTNLYPSGRFVLDRSSAYAGVDYVQVIPTYTSQGQWINESTKIGTQEELSTVLPALPGVSGYHLPIGNYFLDAPGMMAVDVDSGAGFAPFTGTVVAIRRGEGNPGFAPPASVLDAAIGVRLDAGAGTLSVRLRWLERRLAYQVPSISKVRLIQDNTNQWVLDTAIEWRKESRNETPQHATNGLQLAALPNGYQWEFWRRTLREGGFRRRSSAGPVLHARDGRRYVPYMRFDTPASGNLLLHVSAFNGNRQGRFQHKLAVYDPFTGARGPLSDLTVVSNPARDFILLASSPNPRQTVY